MTLPTVRLCDGRDGIRTNFGVQACAADDAPKRSDLAETIELLKRVAGTGALGNRADLSSATADRYLKRLTDAGLVEGPGGYYWTKAQGGRLRFITLSQHIKR